MAARPATPEASAQGLAREAWLAVSDTYAHTRAVCYLLGGGRFDPRAPALRGLAAPARVHCLGRVLHVDMWRQPHYRCASWREDMRNNLRNVALPGTGVPLSVLCVSRSAVAAFVVAGRPASALAAALWEALCSPCAGSGRSRLLAALQLYRKHLLAPSDWYARARTHAPRARYVPRARCVLFARERSASLRAQQGWLVRAGFQSGG